MPEYDDETAQAVDEQSSVATAETDESVEAAESETAAEAVPAAEDDEDFDPVQARRSGL